MEDGEGDWTCAVCTFSNIRFATECQMCGEPQPQSFEQSEDAMRQAIMLSMRAAREAQENHEQQNNVEDAKQDDQPEAPETPPLSPQSQASSPFSPLSLSSLPASPAGAQTPVQIHRGEAIADSPGYEPGGDRFELMKSYLRSRNIDFDTRGNLLHVPIQSKKCFMVDCG